MKQPNKKKDNQWTRPRHRIVRNILSATLGVYSRIKYGIRVEKYKDGGKRPYLILFNHQTAFDQFFVGMAFDQAVYYVASEDLFSNGFVSKVIKYLVAPIPIKKQTTDMRAILNCIKVSREGGTIAIAPEGNRTYSGRTEYMNPAIVPLVKKLQMPVALFRIEDGYGVQPRWSDVVRRGKMRAYVSRVIEPEECASLSNDELFEIIQKELYVNEAVSDGEFRHKKTAEYLERAIYVCPTCGLSEFESRKSIIECKKCHCRVRYLPNKQLRGEGADFPFPYVLNWYDYQSDFINALSLDAYADAPMYQEPIALSEVIPYDRKVKLDPRATVALYGNRLCISGSASYDMSFDEIAAITVLGRNKLNVYYGGKIYQIKGDKRFNAIKYVQIYHRYKNIQSKEENATFLGL
ncbi:MAG: 1-acyl-sn-glycerol-3-phosphate acyltransferase [Clostridia bacterium]|nr:1-acyl-sn-glycerol-3-phosphate acyltransferase [Clostridia bacterium]